jgi:hypothetical protein
MLTIEQIRAMPGTYTLEGIALNAWAIFYDSEPSGNSGKLIIARYSHSEVTTPFDRHWTTDRDYFAHCERVTADNLLRLMGIKQRPSSPEILDPCESS